MRPSESVDTAAVEVQPPIPSVRRKPIARRRARTSFYVGMSGTLLLIVLIGFTPTLYLRPFFSVPEYPFYVLLHGIVLTAWYVGVFVQAALVAGHRTDIHRRLGWVGGGLGVAVVAVSFMVTLGLVPRLKASGVDVEGGIAGLSAIVWSDLASLLFFSIFLSMAIALRQRPDVHKRLMLLALGLYDVVSSKRLYPVTLVGGALFFVVKLVSILVVSSSAVGRSFIRSLG